MNYIELINKAWLLREQGLLTVRDHDLYFYLLHRSNALRWQNPFRQSSEVICAVLGMGMGTLMTRRRHLVEVGLVKFAEGVSRSCPAEYEICGLKNSKCTVEEKRAKVDKKVSDGSLPPLFDEVAHYCAEQHNGVDARRFFDYYHARQWRAGDVKVRDWKALVRKWESNGQKRRNNFANHVNGGDYGEF